MKQFVRLIVFVLIINAMPITLYTQQDDDDLYAFALVRIQRIQESNGTSLDLRFLGLTEIPPEIGELTNLHTLILNDNEIVSFPAELGNLSNLQALYLGRNEISNFPLELGDLTNLQTLDLRENQISRPPFRLNRLTQLRSLIVVDNPLVFPPQHIIDADVTTILEYLSRPHPPYRINVTVMSVFVSWLLSIFIISFGLLRYLCWRAS